MKENQIVIERVFACPKERLFSIWNEREQIEKWYGPKGFNTRVEEYDFTEGGRWKFVMVGPDQKERPVTGRFILIDSPNKVRTIDGFDDHPDKSTGMTLKAEFIALEGGSSKLILTSTHKSVEEKEQFEKMGVPQAWESSFQRIELLLR